MERVIEIRPRRPLPKWVFKLLPAAVVVAWLLSGVYTVGPESQGVVLRFGRHVVTTGPGIHYRLPWPIESVAVVPVSEIQRVEIGFRTVATTPRPRYQVVPEEATMLTGDENIIIAETIVQYRIKDAADYLFKVRDPEGAVKRATQAALRQVVGSHVVDDVLTTGKAQIQDEVRQTVQEILDLYQAGILVVAVQLQDVHPPDAVIGAFQDVASAREDQARIVNQAEAYANEVIPKARGEAAAIIQQAEAYKAARIARAQGDAERFRLLAEAYRSAPEVTRTRLYLEAIEEVLPNVRKVIVDGAGAGVLPLLDLTQLTREEAGR